MSDDIQAGAERALALLHANFKKDQDGMSGVLVLIEDSTGRIDLTLLNNTPTEAYDGLLLALQAMYAKAGRIYPHERMQ